MNFSHLFGPVHSRRLGRSLGVDMVPFKTCTCNCVYCELGSATVSFAERREYVPAGELIDELQHFIAVSSQFDYVTFAGSGEPTLNTALGTVIRFIKKTYPFLKIALLTNSTLLHISDVREEILPCDLVLPSLDAVSEEIFHKINCPCPGLNAKQVVEGLIEFARIYKGQLWVEVFIVPDVNDSSAELELFREVLLKINPTRVQLNSLDRPGACSWVTTASSESLQKIASYFSPLPVEIISRKAIDTITTLPHPENCEGTIVHQLQRRPATLEEIAVMCSATINEVTIAVEALVKKRTLTISIVDGKTFYTVRKN